MSIMPATESPYPAYRQAPPDQQPQDLEGALAVVDSIIFRDGGMDKNEQAVFTAWVQKTVTTAQALAQQQMMSGQSPDQEGLASSSATSDLNTFGGPGGEDMPGYDSEESYE